MAKEKAAALPPWRKMVETFRAVFGGTQDDWHALIRAQQESKAFDLLQHQYTSKLPSKDKFGIRVGWQPSQEEIQKSSAELAKQARLVADDYMKRLDAGDPDAVKEFDEFMKNFVNRTQQSQNAQNAVVPGIAMGGESSPDIMQMLSGIFEAAPSNQLAQMAGGALDRSFAAPPKLNYLQQLLQRR